MVLAVPLHNVTDGLETEAMDLETESTKNFLETRRVIDGFD